MGVGHFTFACIRGNKHIWQYNQFLDWWLDIIIELRVKLGHPNMIITAATTRLAQINAIQLLFTDIVDQYIINIDEYNKTQVQV